MPFIYSLNPPYNTRYLIVLFLVNALMVAERLEVFLESNLQGGDTLIKIVPLFVVIIILCFLGTPTNSLAPDINTGVGRVNYTAYLKNLNEAGTVSSGKLFIYYQTIKLNQLEKFQEGTSTLDEPFDSMSIWREWLGK
jgi:hypothetical protein